MEAIQNKTTNKIVGIKNAGWVIICCFIIAVCIYHFILGNPSNFMNNDPNNHPLPGSFLGTIYKGGVVVPIIQTLLLTVIALSVERYLAIRSAFGRGSLVKFVANIKSALAAGDMKKAQELCDKQGQDNGHHYTTFVNCSQETARQRMVIRVIIHKVGWIPQYEVIDTNCNDKAAYNYPTRIFNTYNLISSFILNSFHDICFN
jgi:hypothetical protein